MNSSRSNPTDLQAMYSFVKDLGIFDYEDSLLDEMVEFTYRYVSTIVEDAELYSARTVKESIDMDDVTLAMSTQHENNFTGPYAIGLNMELSRHRNAMPLPTIASSAGAKLPPDLQYSVTACNYHPEYSSKKPKIADEVSSQNVSNIATDSGSSGTTLSPMPTTALVSLANSVPTQITDDILNSEMEISNEGNSKKRVHEDDDEEEEEEDDDDDDNDVDDSEEDDDNDEDDDNEVADDDEDDDSDDDEEVEDDSDDDDYEDYDENDDDDDDD